MRLKLKSYKIEDSKLYKRNISIHQRLLYVYAFSLGLSIIFIIVKVYI